MVPAEGRTEGVGAVVSGLRLLRFSGGAYVTVEPFPPLFWHLDFASLSPLNPTLLITLASIAGVVWILLAYFRYAYLPQCIRMLEQVPWLKAAACEPLAEREDCEFRTTDGLTLRGSYLPTTSGERQGVILACHELNGDRWGVLPYVERLRAGGFDILTFDFRNHGTSDVTQGYEPSPWLTEYDLTDILAAIHYLQSRPDADPRGFGLLGVSRGGCAALCAAARTPGVLAVVADGSFPTLAMLVHLVKRYMAIYTRMDWLYQKVPDFYVRWMMAWTARVAGRQRGVRFLPTDRYFARVKQPVLLVHGAEDAYIPGYIAEKLQRIISRSELWSVPGAKHNQAILESPEEYGRRVLAFFHREMSVAPAAARQASPAIGSV